MSIPKESNFKDRLYEARKLRELNQEELGKKAKLPATAISHFESGNRKPSLIIFENLQMR